MMLLLAALLTVAWASCPENYHHDPDTNRCLRVFNQPRTFFNAQLQCTRDGGNLAAAPKAKHLRELLPEKALTGLNRMLSSEWKHLDHMPVRPSLTLGLKSSELNRCTVFNVATSSHEAASCEAALPFVCSRPALPAMAGSCPPCPNCNCYANCDNGWTYFDKTTSCYKTFFNANFTAAENICLKSQSHLVSIHSDAENEFVIDLSSTGKYGSTDDQAWIGLYVNLGKWVWTDGTPRNYTAWTTGAPSGSNYNCAFLYPDNNSNSGYRYGQWDVEYCYRSMRAYVCKKGATAV